MQLEYTTILVKDMEESLDFYLNTLDFEIEKELNFPEKTIRFLKNESGGKIELIKENNPKIGLYGLSFHVDDVQECAKNLKDKNPDLEIKIEKTPNTTLGFLKDPNGINIILSQ